MNASANPPPDPAKINQPTAVAIEAWLIAQLAACLNTPAEDIDPEVPFDSYGLDSAEAVGLSGELEDWLQRKVSPTLLYDYPTVAALAEHLGA
ncbi:MAG: acyl carrier protein [Cyanobacteria bacterium]|nr:acyl carrier protein [Cyanobacteriota bacterium]